MEALENIPWKDEKGPSSDPSKKDFQALSLSPLPTLQTVTEIISKAMLRKLLREDGADIRTFLSALRPP